MLASSSGQGHPLCSHEETIFFTIGGRKARQCVLCERVNAPTCEEGVYSVIVVGPGIGGGEERSDVPI